jgi:mannosyltransferase OCH1-like enzyme
MKIPKIIHYCWFGPNQIPEVELKCIKSWSHFLPDYKLMFWNENSFDIHLNNFAKQAYEAGHYAFVSDYVRTKVLYEYGGLYLDTDEEVFEGFKELISKESNCFTAFQTRKKLGAGVMGFTPKHSVIKEFVDYYHLNNFKDINGNINTIANVTMFTDILVKRGLKLNGSQQMISDINVFSREYFYPKKISDTEFITTEKTVAIHYGSCSWMTEKEKKRGLNKFWINVMRPTLRTSKNLGTKIIGERSIQKIEIKIRNLLK